MATRLIYRGDDGQIKNLPVAQPGQTLVADRFGLGWKDFSAKGVPYDDASHLGLVTVQDALLYLFQSLGDVKTEFNDANIDEYRQAVADMEEKIAQIKRTLAGISNTVEVLLHQGQAADTNSDPATDEAGTRGANRGKAKGLDAGHRAMRRHLQSEGSYDNSNSNARAATVQDALDELFSLMKLSSAAANLLKRDRFGALYLDPIVVTNKPHPVPVSQNGSVINIAPAQMAHIRKPGGVEVTTKAKEWTQLKHTMSEIVFDSLASTGSRMTATLDGTTIEARRDGYYYIELTTKNQELMVSIVINDEPKGVTTWRGMLKENDRITAAVFTNKADSITSDVDLFVQLLV